MNAPARPVRRRLWPKTLAGKALAAFVFAVLLLVLAWFGALFVMERRLASALKRLEVEFGLPNTIEAMLPPSVPPKRNAAVPLDEAAAIIEPFFSNLGFVTVRDTVEARLKADPSLGRKLMVAEVDRLLEEADRRREFVPIDPIRRPWVLQPSSAPHRSRRMLLEAEAIVARQLATDGRPEEAVRRLLRILRIGRKWTEWEPWFGDVVAERGRRGALMEELNRILRSGRFKDELYDAIEREIREQDAWQELFVRLYYIEMLKRLDDFDANPNRRTAWWLVGPLAVNDKLLIVDWYGRIMRSIPRPYAEVKDDLETVDAALRGRGNHQIGRLLHPDALGVTGKSYRGDWTQIEARCLRIVNAMAKQGRWDADLDALGLPEQTLTDPINLQRLRLRKTPDGPVIYSVYYDLVDNDGALDVDTLIGLDVGLGPVKKP